MQGWSETMVMDETHASAEAGAGVPAVEHEWCRKSETQEGRRGTRVA